MALIQAVGRERPLTGPEPASYDGHKWDEAMPFPGFKSLARPMGVTTTSVRNPARSLELTGFQRRLKRIGTTNCFDRVPRVQALEKLQAYEAGQGDAQQARGQNRRPEPMAV